MKSTTYNISLLPILSVNFIGTLGYSIVMPFLVFLVNRYGGNEFVYGVLGSIYPAFQFFGAPLLGRWSDSYGRRKVLLLSQIGTFIAWIIFLAALFLPVESLFSINTRTAGVVTITLPLLLLFVARALDGITGGNVSVANAYLADISNDDNRKENFGKMGMSSSLGFIIGPTLAGLLGATYYKEALPVVVAAAISLLSIWFILYKLPESKSKPVDPSLRKASIKRVFGYEQKECYKLKKCKDTGLKAVLGIEHVPLMLLIYFLTFLGFSFFYASFPLHALKALEWDTLQLGIFFSVMSASLILVQGPLLSYLSKKFSEVTLILAGCLFLVLNFILMAQGNSLIIYCALVLFALGNGLMWPSYLSLLSRLGGKEQQGSVQGTANSAGSLASIVGLVLGGYFYGLMGSSIFIATSVVMLAVLFISIPLRKIQIENEQG